jgi:hypothetical protein
LNVEELDDTTACDEARERLRPLLEWEASAPVLAVEMQQVQGDDADLVAPNGGRQRVEVVAVSRADKLAVDDEIARLQRLRDLDDTGS